MTSKWQEHSFPSCKLAHNPFSNKNILIPRCPFMPYRKPKILPNVGGFMNAKFVTNFQSQIGINIRREVYSRFLNTYFLARFFVEDFKHNRNSITSLTSDFREKNHIVCEEEMSKSHGILLQCSNPNYTKACYLHYTHGLGPFISKPSSYSLTSCLILS